MSLWEYDRPVDRYVDRVQIPCVGGRYVGNGWLRWQPGRLVLDAGVVAEGSPQRARSPRGMGVLGPEHFAIVRMRGGGFERMIAPCVVVSGHPELDREGRFSAHLRCLIVHDALVMSEKGFRSGSTLIATASGNLLFDPLVAETRLGDHVIESRHDNLGAIVADLDGVSVTGRALNDERIEISWSLPSGAWRLDEAWHFSDSLKLALRMIRGQSVETLQRELVCRSGTRTEINAQPGSMNTFTDSRWFNDPFGFSSEDFLGMAVFFSRNGSIARTCRALLDTLFAAEDQRTLDAKFFMFPSAFEGLIRTLENRPYATGKPFRISDELVEKVRTTHFADISPASTKEAAAAFRRLRHRAAHPDWVATDKHWSDARINEAFDDIAFLSKFYGQVLFSMVGMPGRGPSL